LPDDDFYTPTDADALRMENELLAFEVDFLKARYAAPERDIVNAENATQELREKLSECHKTRKNLKERLEKVGISPERKAHLLKAEKDLAILMRLMSSSPFGWFFRRKKEFRELEQRHLKG
jgi:ribosome-binding ATPase YchF (GTP1/OBG family)